MSVAKKELIPLLQEKKYAGLITLARADKKILSSLISLSYDKKNHVSWRAIEAIGLIAGDISKTDSSRLRNLTGRLLWMIRDESGGIGWSAPEILGEIVRNSPGLCPDIAPVIFSFHEEQMLTAGVLWAAGRIGRICQEMVDCAVPVLITYLGSRDSTIRGYAALALGEMKAAAAMEKIQKLRNDNSRLTVYDSGELKEETVGALAENAIARIAARENV